jgi:hypothetical protein
MTQNLLSNLHGKFNMFPVTVAAEPDGESPVNAAGVPQRIPLKFRLGKRSQDGFLSTWAGTAQIAVLQTDPEHTNLTQIAIVLAHTGQPQIPEHLRDAFKWRSLSIHRRHRKDLQFRVSAAIARSLPHPLPICIWDGVVCLENVPNPRNCLIALEAQTLTIRRVEPLRQSTLVGPDGLPFSDRPLPEIVIP